MRSMEESTGMSLKEAVEMGEYEPKVLKGYKEWKDLTRNIQWQLIRQGLKRRRELLRTNYAEVFNQIDFSKKPHLAQALKNIEKQLDKLQEEEEKLQVEYSV